MTVWLVRHGESELNAAGVRHRREESPLTTLGIKQAFAVTISATNPIVFCSPLIRAYGTACVISATHGWDAPIIADELIERDYDELCETAAVKAATLLRAWSKTSPGQDIIAVTHAGVIKGLLGIDKTPANGSVLRWKV